MDDDDDDDDVFIHLCFTLFFTVPQVFLVILYPSLFMFLSSTLLILNEFLPRTDNFDWIPWSYIFILTFRNLASYI